MSEHDVMHDFLILLENTWKIDTLFGRQSLKNWYVFGTLARQVEKLARLWHVGT